MESVDHQAMGYDRAITMFSPDGRLLQVEYAKITVKKGIPVIGFICIDGVVLVSDRRVIDKLMVAEGVEKISQVDSHIVAGLAGLSSDGRVLIERAQLKAQQHKVTYDSPVDILGIVKDVCDLKQICTQSGGLRPFGVSILFAGIDNKQPQLFLTEPSGVYFKYYATAIGQGSEEVNEILNKEYKKTINIEQAASLGIKALKKVLDKDFQLDRIEAAYIKIEDPKFNTFTRDELKKLEK
jgi:proteasome alpha subunit